MHSRIYFHTKSARQTIHVPSGKDEYLQGTNTLEFV